MRVQLVGGLLNDDRRSGSVRRATHPGSYPFQRSDPFVLRAAPDVYVVGNQAHYATATYAVGSGDDQHTVRVVLVPSFARTHEVVLLNMATLEPRVVALRT